MLKDHDLHLWLTADDYAYVARLSREQERSKNAILTRMIRRHRAENMADEGTPSSPMMGERCPLAGYCDE